AEVLPCFSFWVSSMPIKGDRICSGSSANFGPLKRLSSTPKPSSPLRLHPLLLTSSFVMSSSSTEVLLKLNQLLELHKLYFDGMADSFTLVGIQHRAIMLLLQSVKQCLDRFKQQLVRIEQGLDHLQQEFHGVETQVPSDARSGLI